MKLLKHIILLLPLLALTAFAPRAIAGAVTCPAYQHDNGASACEFNSYGDTPLFLTAQNTAVAASLNANPTGPAAAFALQFGSIPINQQKAIMGCQLGIFDNGYFGLPTPVGCPLANGQLDIASLIAANPASSNPGNAPSVTFSGGVFTAVVPPQPGPAIPVIPIAPIAGTNICGPLAFTNLSGSTFYPGPGAMKNSASPNVSDGQAVNQAGTVYTAHLVHALMGLSVYCTIP